MTGSQSCIHSVTHAYAQSPAYLRAVAMAEAMNVALLVAEADMVAKLLLAME